MDSREAENFVRICADQVLRDYVTQNYGTDINLQGSRSPTGLMFRSEMRQESL